jgi:hypothetical protein
MIQHQGTVWLVLFLLTHEALYSNLDKKAAYPVSFFIIFLRPFKQMYFHKVHCINQ